MKQKEDVIDVKHCKSSFNYQLGLQACIPSFYIMFLLYLASVYGVVMDAVQAIYNVVYNESS